MKKKGFGVLAVLMLSMLLSVTAFAKGKWKVEEGNRYYYNEDGTKQKGWLTLKKGTYYFLLLRPTAGSAVDRDHGNRCAADRRKDQCIFKKRNSAEGI